MHVAVDDATRLAHVEVLADERRDPTPAFLLRALRWFRSHGIRTERVMTGSGSACRFHRFVKALRRLGIEHRLTPPKSPRTNPRHCPRTGGGLRLDVARFNGRIEEVLQGHDFRSGEELETTLHRRVRLCNQLLPQSALGSQSPSQAMKDRHKLKPQLFRKQPYHLPGCDKGGATAPRPLIWWGE